MSNEDVLEAVKTFMDDNGNKNFTNKELIIYFNKRHEVDIQDVKNMLRRLPCITNATRITKIETTNKIIAGAVGIVLTIFGLIISLTR